MPTEGTEGGAGTGPLDGVRVVELTGGLAGQAAGALWADLGAEVVRFPAPGGGSCAGGGTATGVGTTTGGGTATGGGNDGQQAGADLWQVWSDRRKVVRGPGLASEERLRDLKGLLTAADLFVSDLPPGHLERIGLDAVTCRAQFPRLVHVWMPPQGRRGRWSHLHPDPLLLAATTAFADQVPAEQDRPVAPAVPTFEYLQGAMAATSGIAGLWDREQSGQGTDVAISGLDAMAAALATMMMHGYDVAGLPKYGRTTKGVPNFRLYQGSDGAWFFLAALTPGIFLRALDAVGRMDIMVRDDVAGEFANLMSPTARKAVQAEMEDTIGAKTAAEWLDILRAADVPVAPVWSRQEWLDAAIVPAAERVHFAHATLGDLLVPVPPVALADSPMRSGGRSPEGLSAGWGASATQAAGASAGPTDMDPTRSGAETTGTGPTAPGPTARPLPLAGLRVIDGCSFVAGPFASSLLADFGAEVIKVEPVDGDPYGVFVASHAVVNQLKKIVTIDLRDPDGRQVFLDLLGTADLLVENFMPDSLERLGLDPATIAAAAPRLVRCSVSAFGPDNDWSTIPGFDPVLQSITGLAVAQGGTAQPIQLAAPVVDIATGVLAALGSVAALLHRRHTGRPQRLSTSLASGAMFIQSAEMTSRPGAPLPAPGVLDYLGPSPQRRLYQTADGWIAVSVADGDSTAPLCEALGLPAEDPIGTGTAATVEALLRQRPTDAWLDAFALRGVPAVQALRRDVGILDHHLTANGFSHLLDIPGMGRFQTAGTYSEWNGIRRHRGVYPAPGRHTVEILTGAGIDASVVENLLDRGVVSGPR